MKKCRKNADDWFYAGGSGASVIGQFIQQGSNIVFGSISQAQQDNLARQTASRQFGQQQTALENQLRLTEQQSRSQSSINRIIELRKQGEYKTIQKIGLVTGVFVIIGIGIYYASKS